MIQKMGIDAACPGLADARSRAFPLEAAAAMSESRTSRNSSKRQAWSLSGGKADKPHSIQFG
jgi:hypothetical protein